MPNVPLCVSASRAAILLLHQHPSQHPFTIHLLYQVSWSVDILFVSILQNRLSPQVYKDLELLETVVHFFETYDPQHETVPLYHVVKSLASVASSVLQSSRNSPAILPEMPLQEEVPQQMSREESGFLAGDTSLVFEKPCLAGANPNLQSATPTLNTWGLPIDYNPELWHFEYLEDEYFTDGKLGTL
ncbi:fungal specific transcription factor [Colletotrichum truncatum]|uniref:Fungal specific transcription factor n=1 Tax=Colletotrichum truncatum TaxID=5467 RepID=A0ACC3Z6I1_COLTU|nr:fungal specific transcription factor [Colletotrichum truncatum]KAF6788038.1 fungal specific transcription factor [Colletotrichum truncatum]